MGLTIRQYLRSLDNPVLYKLFKESNLKEEEYNLVVCAFIHKYLVAKTCMQLNISKSKYHSMLNEILIKIEYKIKEYDKLRTLN